MLSAGEGERNMIEALGFSWMVGRNWGLAHPDHICYADEKCVEIGENGEIRLGILKDPAEFNSKIYDWGVGYLSSIEAIKYGTLELDFTLPTGNNLWPALWMYDCKTWPPEIDIVEGWSGDFIRSSYLRFPGFNKIFPGVVLERRLSRSGGFMGKCTPACYIKKNRVNTCALYWTPEIMEVRYNGRLVMREKDPRRLEQLNASSGMNIHLQNYVTNDFTEEDYKGIKQQDLKVYKIRYTQ